jgi:hypothetical protein
LERSAFAEPPDRAPGPVTAAAAVVAEEAEEAEEEEAA